MVHAHHGIGRFVAMLRMPVDGVEKDYIKIAYAGQDVLYVPATSLDLVSKYIGPGEDNERTKLNKLGGTEWAKTTRKAKAAAKDLAEGLIRLYAQRQRLAGHAFSPDSPWQQEFEDAFPYTETDDQLQAIRDIKADMEQPRPMDRLLCGDVGYGKTEVALRAVMKCILDGKQAAILVPTTVLAQQHYATAVNRFRSFPVNIEVLSRFRTPAQVRDILARTQAGKVDLLIGTHKLLQKDLKFHDLGLLVIDEEQRFGVTHKEKLRERARQVDTLTLSATPIPRTLNMALSGIRDMSTIEEPPHDRQPVQTYVMEHEWPVIAEAIRRELSRGGQVYYLHNRVENIESTAGRLRQWLGGGCGHRHCPRQNGRAGAELRHAADGRRRDPGAGVHHHHRDRHRYPQRQHPDHRGRGPAGPVPAAPDPGPHRPQRPPGVCLSDLSPRQGADGGGRQAAVRHPGVCGLRLRLPHCHAGPGDPRGGEPAGPGAVRLSDECGLRHVSAAAERRGAGAAGEGKDIRPDCSADLATSAHIPERYVPSAHQRMDLYRRMAAIRTTEEASDLVDELTDRYGDPPKPVMALLDVALLRAAAADVFITDITQRAGVVAFTFDSRVDVPSLMAVCSMPGYRNRLRLSAGEPPRLRLHLAPGRTPSPLPGS